jgi:hypothetical protein
VAQFAPESLAQFAPDLVAQFDRNIQLSGKIEIPLPMRIGIFLIIYHNLCSVIVKITIAFSQIKSVLYSKLELAFRI